MTLNFQSHGPVIQAAYNRVASSKTGDEWAIFDYEGNSNIIKVGDEGDGGLEEFSYSFNSGKLQYGLISVKLCEKAISKIVLVHWQGEGVPSSRVATATSHVNDVRRHLKTVHTVVYARSEMDVEPDSIKREVSKLPASYAESKVETSYSIPTSVSSVYKPVKPHVDINVKEREDFWDKMNVEEKRRQDEQLKKHLNDEKKWTEERKQLADEITHKSETAINSIPVKNPIASSPMPDAPSPVPVAPSTVPVAPSPVSSVAPSKNLISGRIGMFQKKDDVPVHVPSLPVVAKPKFEQLSLYDHVPETSESITAQPKNIPASSPMIPSIPVSSGISQYDVPPAQTMIPPKIIPSIPASSGISQYDVPPSPVMTPPKVIPSTPVSNGISQYDVPPASGVCAIALWDYQAEDATEITFDPNDVITEIEQIDDGWWRGKAPNGTVGLFPANYVKLL